MCLASRCQAVTAIIALRKRRKTREFKRITLGTLHESTNANPKDVRSIEQRLHLTTDTSTGTGTGARAGTGTGTGTGTGAGNGNGTATGTG